MSATTTAAALPSDFAIWTLRHAQQFLATLADEDGAKNRKFYEGDHWQGGDGWLSELPTGEGSLARIAAIARMFIPEPLIAEAVNNHRDGVIAREPLWRFVPTTAPRVPRSPRQPAPQPRRLGGLVVSPVAPAPAEPTDEDATALMLEAAMTDKWDERDTLATFKAALATALLFGRAPLRLYVPPGLRTQRIPDGPLTLAARDFAEAIRLLYCDALDPQTAGVYTDPDTKRRCSVYVRHDVVRNLDFAELSYLDAAGRTVLRVVGADGEAEAPFLADLGGRLFIYDLTRSRLIGEPERRNQIVGNFAKTLMARQLELGGYRERNLLNVQPPGYWEDQEGKVWTGATGQKRTKFVALSLPTGPGVDRYLQGAEMTNKDGAFQGFATPSLAYEDPVPLAEPERGLANARLSILAGTGQLYLAMSGDSQASGVARIQARAVHEARLGESKTAVDGALRWYLEFEARFAATVIGTERTVAGYRAEANAIIDTGPLTPDEQRAIVDQMDKGYLSKETGLGMLGRDDPSAELQRIKDERNESDSAFLGLAGGAQRGTVAPGGQQQQSPGDVLNAELAGAGTGTGAASGTNGQQGAA